MSAAAVLWSVVGVAAGVIFCQGYAGASQLVALSRSGYNLLDQFLKHRGTSLCGLITSTLLSLAIGVFYPRVEGPKLDPLLHGIGITVLGGGLISEVWSLLGFVQAYQARDVRLGLRGAHLMGADSFPSRSLLQANCIMCGVYGLLLVVYSFMFFGGVLCCHMDPVLNRPLNTLRYVEWSFAVPCLMWMLGRLLLEQPPEVVLPPIIHTVVYIWLAWAGQMVVPTWARAILISSSFTIWVEASLAQWRWNKVGGPLRSAALLFQMAVFFWYGVVYLIALAEFVSPEVEEILYTCSDITAKMGHSAFIVAVRRAYEVDLFFVSLRSYLDVMVELRALVGAQFDLLIHCQVAPQGLLISGTTSALERCVGKSLMDQPLPEICFNEEDRRRLQQHRISNPRRPLNPAFSTWERQEGFSQIADVLRVDLAWKDSPTGSMPSELFVAGTASSGAAGDVVLIGVRLLQEPNIAPPALGSRGSSRAHVPSVESSERAISETSDGSASSLAIGEEARSDVECAGLSALSTGRHLAAVSEVDDGAEDTAPQLETEMKSLEPTWNIDLQGSTGDTGPRVFDQTASVSSHDGTIKTKETYRTIAGETKNVQAEVKFVTGAGQLSALNFTIASSCSQYHKQIEAESEMWEWEKMTINESEVETVENIGRGSFAQVFKVKWRGGFYAQKMLNTTAWNLKKRGVPQNVRREAHNLFRLAEENHPHLCRCVGIIAQPRMSFVFELCEGGSMDDLLRTEHRQPLPWVQRHAVFRQTLDALMHLHKRNLIHRDLKSNNVLLFKPVLPDSEPHVKVADVGLARWFTQHESASFAVDGEHEPGAMTPMSNLTRCDWRAPEMAHGFYGLSVDVYAFGVFFLEVCIWTPALPQNWRSSLESAVGAQHAQALADVASSCLLQADTRPTAEEVLGEVDRLQVPGAEDSPVGVLRKSMLSENRN